MNYRHAYHAGNFADVLKHAVLMECLAHLKRKEAPFRVIDTHAGAGRYRLDAGEAATTGEWRHGIGRLLGADSDRVPEPVVRVLEPYLTAVRAANPTGLLTAYPGSPLLMRSALRSGDALVANELHPDEAAALRSNLAGDRRCKVTTLDGYAALKALLPPMERRGLVLIDPPFEAPGELVRMTTSLGEALERFATGIFLLWYPIKDPKPVARFHRGVMDVVEAAGLPPALKVELLLRPARNPTILNGAGLIVVNPPYKLAESLTIALPFLANRLGDTSAGGFDLGPVTRAAKVARPAIQRRAGKSQIPD